MSGPTPRSYSLTPGARGTWRPFAMLLALRNVFGSRPRRRIGAFGAAVIAAVAAAVVVPAIGQSPPAPAGPEACSPTRTETLYAVQRPGGLAYGRTPDTATIPGPTLEMTEGECLAVRLINRTGQPTSIHSHGVDYTIQSDGTPHSGSCTPDGEERTYVFQAHRPGERSDGTRDPGSAGYWHYHDHCGGGDHGTAGINAGLFGAFIVRRPGDSKPDVPPFVLVMIGQTFNLQTFPNTPLLRARQGQRVEFVVIGHGDLFHTFHLHGHRWANTRTGLPGGSGGTEQLIDNRTIGPADSFGFQVIAGEHVGPGRWMYHCHVQGHADAGMAGFFQVDPATGPPPSSSPHPAAEAPMPSVTRPKRKKSAHLLKPSARLRGSRLLVTGRLVRQAVGGVVVTLRVRIGKRTLTVSRRTTARKGRYRLLLPLWRRARLAKRASATVTVRYFGDSNYNGHTRRISLRLRARK